MPRAASISSTMRRLNGNRKYSHTAWLIAALNSIGPYLMQLVTTDIFAAGEEWARLRRPGVIEMIHKRLSRLPRLGGRTSDACPVPPPLCGLVAMGCWAWGAVGSGWITCRGGLLSLEPRQIRRLKEKRQRENRVSSTFHSPTLLISSQLETRCYEWVSAGTICLN